MGTIHNRLTRIHDAGRDKWGAARGLYECECGIKKVVNDRSVKTGKTRSCGCLNKEVQRHRSRIRKKTHSAEVILYKPKKPKPDSDYAYSPDYVDEDFARKYLERVWGLVMTEDELGALCSIGRIKAGRVRRVWYVQRESLKRFGEECS